MSKSNSAENAWLGILFNATAIANVCDNAASSPLTNLFVGLHSSDPGEAGSQTTNEITTGQHGGYARVSVARTSGGWTVTANQVVNVGAITFPTGTAGTGTTATYFGIGSLTSGAGVLYYSGELIGPGVVITGVNAGTDTLTATSHGFSNNNAVFVRNTDGTLPGGLSAGTTYFVVGATTNTFQLSLTQGGSAVDITDAGNGTHRLHLNKNIPVGLNTIPTISASQLIISED